MFILSASIKPLHPSSCCSYSVLEQFLPSSLSIIIVVVCTLEHRVRLHGATERSSTSIVLTSRKNSHATPSEYKSVELNIIPALLAILHFSVYAAIAMAQRANILTNQRAIIQAFQAHTVINQ